MTFGPCVRPSETNKKIYQEKNRKYSWTNQVNIWTFLSVQFWMICQGSETINSHNTKHHAHSHTWHQMECLWKLKSYICGYTIHRPDWILHFSIETQVNSTYFQNSICSQKRTFVVPDIVQCNAVTHGHVIEGKYLPQSYNCIPYTTTALWICL